MFVYLSRETRKDTEANLNWCLNAADVDKVVTADSEPNAIPVIKPILSGSTSNTISPSLRQPPNTGCVHPFLPHSGLE